MSSREDSSAGEQYVWVLTEPLAEEDLERLGGVQKISAEKLGELLQSFTTGLGQVLDRVESVSRSFELSEITIGAQLSGEIGFALVGKGGAEAGVELRFTRKQAPSAV